MPNRKAIEDFCASRNVLAANIDLFHGGHRDMYRVVAVELRKLLCDGKNSLIVRLFPNPIMHPLPGVSTEFAKLGATFWMTSAIEFDGKGGSRIVNMFDLGSPRIPLDQWLDQGLFNSQITIRELIRSVADKEAAHADPNYNSTLLFSKGITLVAEDIHKQHIVAIGEYVLVIMNNTVNQYPNVFGGPSAP